MPSSHALYIIDEGVNPPYTCLDLRKPAWPQISTVKGKLVTLWQHFLEMKIRF